MRTETKSAAPGGTSTESRMTDQSRTTYRSRSVYHGQDECASVFDAVKDALPMVEVVQFYGLEPDRAGFVCCPFHNERTPSCKIYQNRFKCFGCGASGDQVDFVARLLGLDPLGAVRRLNADFHLRLYLDAAPDPQRLQERRKIDHAKQLFEEWRHKILNQIDAAIRTANLADFAHLSDGEATALVYREALEHWAGILMHGNLENQMTVFRDREGVTRLCAMILQNTPTRSRTA